MFSLETFVSQLRAVMEALAEAALTELCRLQSQFLADSAASLLTAERSQGTVPPELLRDIRVIHAHDAKGQIDANVIKLHSLENVIWFCIVLPLHC